MTIYTIENFPHGKNRFFLDANVLLNLHGVNLDCNKEEDYSTIIEMIIEENMPVYMDVVTLSEFINRYSQKLLKERFGIEKYSKKLRGNKDYKKVLTYVEMAVKEINESYKIKFCIDGYDFLNTVHSERLAQHLEKLDFNDLVICEICKKHGCILVTDDKDYRCRKEDLDILTANRKFFSSK